MKLIAPSILSADFSRLGDEIKAVENALHIDQNIPEAHISRGCIESIYNWNWREAEKNFLSGIKLNPNYSIGHQWYAINYLVPMGRFPEARVAIRKAIELEPLSLVINATVGLVLYFAREYDEAVHQLERGEHKLALEHLNLAENCFKQLNDLKWVTFILHEKFRIHLQMGEFEQALGIADSIVGGYLETNNKNGLALIHIHKSDVLRELGENFPICHC